LPVLPGRLGVSATAREAATSADRGVGCTRLPTV
jgi:hypothetical protein